MNVDVKYIAKRYKPLCDTPYGMLTYHDNALYLYSDASFDKIIEISNDLKSRIVKLLRLLERITRGEPKSAVFWNDFLYVAVSNAVLEIDIARKVIIKQHSYRKKGIHTSRLAAIAGVEGFADCIAYGEYFDNASREEVCIFTKEAGEEVFVKKYAFPAGKVRHIHSLIPDIHNGCVYIFTGDSDEESGIWRATNNFSQIEPILVGNQSYRACIGFADGENIVFATDIPSRQNNIYAYQLASKELRKIAKISGTCTTGCMIGSKMIFGSTVETVEPKGKSKLQRFKYLLGNTRAPGIEDDYARLYMGEVNSGFVEIIKYKKDGYPAGLCQFGRINAVPDKNNRVYIFPQSVHKYDGKMGYIDIRTIEV